LCVGHSPNPSAVERGYLSSCNGDWQVMNPDVRFRSGRKPAGAAAAPLATICIAGTCFVVWLVALAAEGGQSMGETWLAQAMIVRSDRVDLRSFLIHPFFHESWVHLLLNCVAIGATGRALEARWGPLRFSAFFASASALGGLTAIVIGGIEAHSVAASDPAPAATASFGASAGALAGLAAYTLAVGDRPVLQFLTLRYLVWTAIILGSAGLVFLWLTAHLSGIAAGAALPALFARWDRLQSRKVSARRAEAQEKVSEIRLRVDQILEKISRTGMESLSREERGFLRDASRHFRNRD